VIKKKWIALVMAGGQGSRLGALTQYIAKPAVPFGGKYRIIDFTLSNCSNSGIDTVGVLTQYRPLVLNSYIGIGWHWDLNPTTGGVTLLPPFVNQAGGEWYLGTANAVFQNLEFVDLYNPDYLVVLSGDHIYKMDYSQLLDFHKEKQASATIAVIEVPWQEAKKFGIMKCDQSGRIIEFEEKPQDPQSNLASMGIYIFNLPFLKKYLEQDEQDSSSAHDFGKNIIPAMVRDKAAVFAYPFQGYWKDVGTVESYWQANMDLLGPDPGLNLNDPQWRIYSENSTLPPHYLAPTAKVRYSLVNEGGVIRGEVDHSVLFPGVTVGPGSIVRNSIIMPNVKIGSNVVIENAIVHEKINITDNCRISNDKSCCLHCTVQDCFLSPIVEENIVVITNTSKKAQALIS